jgi:hypothetical protein
MKYTSTLKAKLIYVFRINDKEHKGCLKIGETTTDDDDLKKAAHQRIKSYTQTAGVKYDLIYTETCQYIDKGVYKSFSDHDVRNVLYRSRLEKKVFDLKNNANEWVITDLETVKKAIQAVKAGRKSLKPGDISKERNPVVFRPEQREAIEKTIKQFKKGNEMLWFAKMRFGKTLSALQVVKENKFSRTLILTHRPVVDISWFEDFDKIFYDDKTYNYGSKKKGESFDSLEKQHRVNKTSYVYFASLQDLRGSEKVGGSFNKNNNIFKVNWDFIIVDEAHEGTQTNTGKNVLKALKKAKTKVLHLSGTPFNLLDNYQDGEIFTWDYVMEQRAKAEWDKIHFGDPNPYNSLPKLNVFTYDLGGLIDNFHDEDKAFNFREFFKVKDKSIFLHEKAVKSFLDLLCKEDHDSNYPFSTDEYRNNFRHSLWVLPGVNEAKALSSLLQKHPVFSQFTIVNVAGEGDEEEVNEEALNKVQKAISESPNKTYTITLTCGRLTTGVSVPAWTAVLMLSGSYNTSASSYMQTIFRVQTPATIDGKVKTDCYVFDFAPDRTLKVIAEVAKISAKAGKTSGDDRRMMGEFLNFCPIIGIHGSRMSKYNVENMLEQLKRVFVDRVIRNGFEDGYLYNNDQLMTLGSIELKDFDKLKKIIGKTRAMPKNDDVDINSQGFTEEEFEKLERAEIKQKEKKKLTKEELKLLKEKEEKRKQRETAVSILRGISIRMPLLLYGAEVSDESKQITIDNFTQIIDDKSWEEFMPKGVTKQIFSKFKKYYEPDVFRAAGKKIRAMARAADQLSIEERIEHITTIFSNFRNPDKETVLTPWRVVNLHLGDCLGGYIFLDEKTEKIISRPRYVSQGIVTENVFSTESRVLEINSKSGLYPLFLTYNIYRNRVKQKYKVKEQGNLTIEEQYTLWDQTVSENIFVLCKTPMAESITKRTLVGFRNARVNTKHLDNLVYDISNSPDDFESLIKKGKSFWKANRENNMKFNAIVGNPPYMEMDGGAQASAKPIYNQFVDIAKKIKPQFISMIIPTRWYSGGKGLDEFRESMLNDKRIVTLHDYLNPEQVFPKTNIRGGICYFLWDSSYDNHLNLTKVVTHKENKEPISVMRSLKSNVSDIFIRHEEALLILEKILRKKDFKSFENNVSPRKPFGLDGAFSNDSEFKESKAGLINPLICYGKGKKIGYIEKGKLNIKDSLVNCFKVFTPYANNIGTELNDDNLNTFVGKPGSICTETYIMLGFNLLLNETSANNLANYFTTRFSRFLHSLAKSSQHGTSKTYKFVPLQDFTSNSDIDWSKSIPEIDQQLYAKYNFSEEEIDFIERMIKPMK